MSIRELKRKDGSRFQVMYRGSDSAWITKVFASKRDAKAYELCLKQQKSGGNQVTNTANQLTLDEYFCRWLETVKSQASPGHRREQLQRYQDYVSPLIGSRKIRNVGPDAVVAVLSGMVVAGKSEQTQLHVYNLLKKMLGDAVELFRLLDFNPVLRKLRPKVPIKETAHLTLEQSKKLIEHVEGKEYCVGIWLQLLLGLRACEMQALTWSDVDLDNGILYVRRSYSRKDSWASKEKVIKDYPKNKKQRSYRIPVELLHLLKCTKLQSQSEYVTATSSSGNMLSYEHYVRTLRRYCIEAGVPEVSTHGLRHSTAAIYMQEGASRDDIAQLLGNPTAVDRYVHVKDRRVDRIADVIRLLTPASKSPNVA